MCYAFLSGCCFNDFTREVIMSYNGYENYETWNVCLWIANDEGLYNLSMSCANYDEFVGTMRELDSLETPDHVAWNDSNLDIDEIEAACFSEDAEDDEVEEDDAAMA